VTAARAIWDAGARAIALSGLAPHLGEPERSRVLAEAVTAARAIATEGVRAEALSALAPHLGPELLSEALGVARAIGYERYRALALSALAGQLASLPSSSLIKAWSVTLHQLLVRKRNELLCDLKALTPVILALGGRQAAEELASAIVDVGRWWP
jgi:hypothetical protein